LVLQRYVAGNNRLNDFLLEEGMEADLLRTPAFKLVLGGQAAVLERLVASVSDAYIQEVGTQASTAEQRQATRIRMLLAGELLDTSDLNYNFGGFHLGVIAAGPTVADAIRALSTELDCRLLSVHDGESIVWAWFGGRRPLEFSALASVIRSQWPPQLSLSLGEPGEGLDGWRLTHRQAMAVWSIALHGPGSPVRYADAALLSSILRDEVHTASLRQLYLDPLAQTRNSGETLRRTLRVYLNSERNIKSTASRLGINRNTVAGHLRTIEERIGRPLDSCFPELDAALRLDEMSASDVRSP
jgi:hypothetical protein